MGHPDDEEAMMGCGAMVAIMGSEKWGANIAERRVGKCTSRTDVLGMKKEC